MELIFFKILPLFCIIGIGVLLKKTNIAADSWVDILNTYGLYIGFPSIIITSLQDLDIAEFSNHLGTAGFNFFILIGILLTLYLILRKQKISIEMATVFIICSFFGNVAYLGFPLLSSITQGQEGEISIVIAVYSTLLFSVGILLLNLLCRKNTNLGSIIMQSIFNPFFIAVIIGIVIAFAQITLPGFVLETLFLLKGSASPVVLLSLGIFLGRKHNFKGLLRPIIILVGLKMVFIPFLFFGLAAIVDSPANFKISIMESAMPLAITPFALSQKFSMNKDLIAITIFISTLISILTLPLLGNILGI